MRTQPDTSSRAKAFGADTGLFFLLVYLYVWLVVDPRLIHHAIGVVTPYYPFSFTTGWPFLWEHLARPGGLVEYGTRLLTNLYGLGWLGALIVTAAAWATCLGIDVVTRVAGRPRGMVIRYVPAVLVLVMYGSDGHPLRTVLSLLVALFCFVLYLHPAARGTARASVALVVLCVVAYHVAGAGSLLLPVLVAIDEALITRRKLVALVALLCGLGVPWLVGGTLFDLPFSEAYGDFLIPEWGGMAAWTWPYVLVLYLCFPAVLAGAALHRALLARRTAKVCDRTSSQTGPSWTEKIPRFLS